jgi:hypothetical protein
MSTKGMTIEVEVEEDEETSYVDMDEDDTTTLIVGKKTTIVHTSKKNIELI